MCELCTEVSLEFISSPLTCTDYLHAYLIPLGILCSQTMCQRKLFLCASTIVITSKRGGALKARVLIVWYSHVGAMFVLA